MRKKIKLLEYHSNLLTVSVNVNLRICNISAGAVIAAAYFPGEVMFPVMIGTLFQQVLAALFGKLLAQKKEKQEFC